MKTTRQVLTLVTLLSATFSLCGQVPSIVTYQGRLQASGTNFNGAGQFKFAIVNPGTNAARQATATATVSYGFIVAVNPVAGGAGYTTAPAVTITDPTGSNAVVTANLLGGAVVSFNILNNGRDYSSSPTVIVAPPPPNMAYLTYWSHDGTSVNGSEPTTSVPVPVSQGLFAVGLGDTTLSNMSTLPDSVFGNPNPSLRIWFSDGAGAFQQLSPDQPFTSAAYALMAVTASNLSGTLPAAGLSGTYYSVVTLNNSGNSFAGNGSALTSLNASALASGTVPSARLSGTYSSAVTLNNPGNSFTGSGVGLTSLNASALTAGTLPGPQLGGTYGNAVNLTNALNSFTGNGSGLTSLNGANLTDNSVTSAKLAYDSASLSKVTAGNAVVSAGLVGIGTTYPSHVLTVASSTTNAVLRLIGPGYYGSEAVLNFGDSSYVYLSEDVDDSLTIYGLHRTAIMGGSVGIGTTNPSTKLDVAGTVTATAFQGDGIGISNLNANALVSGTLPSGRLAGTYSSAVTLNNDGNSFAGNGGGLTNLNANNLASGTAPLSRGGTGANLSQTGGPGQFVKQTAYGAALSVNSILASELPTHSHSAADINAGLLPVIRGGTATSVVGASGAVACSTGSGYGFSSQGMLNQILKSGGNGTPTWGAVNLASPTEVTGTLAGANGGTGLSTYNVGDLLYASAPSTLSSRSIGNQGDVLTVYNSLPTWRSANDHNHLGQTWTGSGSVGLQVESSSSTGYGLDGRATSTVGNTRGVYGEAAADNGVGVYGVATSSGNAAVHIGVVAVAAGGDKNLALFASTYDDSRPTAYNLPRPAVIAARANSGDDLIQGYETGYNLRFRVSASGTIYAVNTTVQSVDLAECVPVSEAVEAGDVVEVDPTLKETFRRCREQCSPRVAGVISTRPGLLLGHDDPACNSDAKPPMALAGRVPVKVTLEGGPIRPGDLLTSSSTPGRAMKAVEPWRGGLIGTALESFGDNDSRDRTAKGTIVMLVHLRPAPATDQALFTRMQGEAAAQKEQLEKLQEMLAAQQQAMGHSEARLALLERALALKKEKPAITDLAVSIGQTQEP